MNNILNKWYRFDNTIHDIFSIDIRYIKPIKFIKESEDKKYVTTQCEFLQFGKYNYEYNSSIDLILKKSDFENYFGKTDITDEYIKEKIVILDNYYNILK
jgi:hypothetical protein